jgi:hypothetical protein
VRFAVALCVVLLMSLVMPPGVTATLYCGGTTSWYGHTEGWSQNNNEYHWHKFTPSGSPSVYYRFGPARYTSVWWSPVFQGYWNWDVSSAHLTAEQGHCVVLA